MIELKNINKYFFKGKKNEVHVINNTSLSLPDKGLVTILGESGSGKTTLLNVIGGLDNFDSGSLTIDNTKITNSNVDTFRNLNIGYIFQDYRLVDDMTVFDNVAISLKLCGLTNKEEINKRVTYVLEVLGINRYRKRLVTNLSGGERQRVGIARAIVKNPRIVICDEPTGNLDSKNSVEIMNIIKSISKERLVILVTHETSLAEFYSNRIIKIVDGKIVSDEENEVKDELDYELDNKIYLKDIENRNELSIGDNEINIFYDTNTKQKINIVIRDNNIFIQTDSKNTEVINDNKIELVDDHKKKIDKTVYEQYEFNLDEFNKKNKSIFTFIEMFIKNFKGINSLKGMKRIIVLTSCLASIIIFYSIATMGKINDFTLKDYAQNGENVVSYEMQIDGYETRETLLEKYQLYEKYKNDPEVYNISIGSNFIGTDISSSRFIQTSGNDNVQGVAAVETLKSLSEKDIIYGRMPKNDNEIVLDRVIYDRICLEDRNQLLNIGILDIKDIVGTSMFITPFDELEIVGIADKQTPVVYANDEVASKTGVGSHMSVMNYEKWVDKISLIEGDYPVNDFEILLNKNSSTVVKVGDMVDPYGCNDCDNKILKVSGFYDSNAVQSVLYSPKTIEYLSLYRLESMYFEVKDKEDFIKKHSEIRWRDLTKTDESVFIANRMDGLLSSIRTSITVIIFVLVEIFFVLRTSLLSRVKEIGIYRSIGVRKLDIYKMFLGEVFTLVSVGALTGAIGAYAIFARLNRYPIIYNDFMINPITFISTLLVLYLATSIVTVIPVYFIIRKYPAQILTRKDA